MEDQTFKNIIKNMKKQLVTKGKGDTVTFVAATIKNFIAEVERREANTAAGRRCNNCGNANCAWHDHADSEADEKCWKPETKELEQSLSPLQLACIKLCVPRTNEPWLNKLIEEARLQRLAGQVLAGSEWRNVAKHSWLENEDQFALYTKKIIRSVLDIVAALALELDKKGTEE